MCLAIPGKIISINQAEWTDEPWSQNGKVSFGGVIKDVNLSCVPTATVGNYVIVHVGFALCILDEEAALQTLADLQQLMVA